MTLVERIKKVAKERGWNLKTTAEKAGIGINSIYRWKTQTPTAESLAKVANVLDVSVDYLLGRSPDLLHRLRDLRTEEKRTSSEVAQAVGISPLSYQSFEDGHRMPDQDTLQKLADFFGVSAEYLLGDTDDRNGKRMTDLKKEMHSDTSVLAWDGKPIPPEEMEMIRRILDGGK